MKALIPLLLVSTSALAVTTVQFAHRMSTERKRADEALAANQKHEARIRELEKAQGTLEQQLMDVQRPPMAEPAAAPPPRTAAAPEPVRRANLPHLVAFSRAEAVNGGPAGFVARPWVQSEQSPAAQRYMQWQRKSMMRRQYQDLASALGVSQAQADKLIEAISDNPARMMLPTFSATPEMKTRVDDEVAAIIGQDKVAQWQDYQKSLPERWRVNNVSEQMRMMDVPLTDDQRQQLTDIMIDQSQQNPRPTPDQSVPPDEMMKASMKWEDDNEKAFLERAKSVLTREQYERYRDYQAWQSEMRANSMRYLPSAVMSQSGQLQSSGANVVRFVTPATPLPPPPSDAPK